MSGTGGNIKVVVRVRPFNSREKERGAKCIVQMKDTQTVLTPPAGMENKAGAKGGAKNHGPQVFNFDRSYWSFNKNDPTYAGQDNLYQDLGEPLLDNAFGGYNNCIFAYGQTGSGKSYSMMGYGEEYGVIPKICQNMFERINIAQKDPHLKCTVEVSYLEIYNERVRDLLNPSTKSGLKVREHPSTGPYVEDLAKLVVGSFAEIEHLMDEGNKARTVAATNMNETSSRSHAVFTLILSQKRHDEETNMDTEKVSRISLVDLAGSERATSTGATGQRLKEGAEINRSLSTLGRVIAALADVGSGKSKKKGAAQVPYRDSVLTWLLKDSLGGNSMTAMIAAISPADINFDETLSTLRYADSAKRIKNHAVVNEDPNARMIRELKEELEQLRSKLSGGGGIAEEVYAADTPPELQIVTITTATGEVKKVSKAEIAEQLEQSEKILTDLNQTWEERLERTKKVHKERETALEELGISIEKGFIGLSTPKKMPHLVNLSDDPLLAECLVYNIKPGTTQVGNVDTSTTAQIRLNGTKILQDHCRFENDNGVVTLIPNEGAAVMVNGLRIEKPRRLRTGFRIILGDFHIFRFNHPQEARAERDRLRQSATMNSAVLPQSPEHTARHTHTMSQVSDILEKHETESNSSRPESPAAIPNSRDMEWSFARREAATAWLGDSSKINTLTDDELDNLLEEMQRVKAIRKERSDSRLEDDDGTESVTSSFPGIREKYASTATLADDLSLDTLITMPGTPQTGEVEERLRLMKEEMQGQLEQQKHEYQEQLKAQEHMEIDDFRAEKARMEVELANARAEMQKELEKQRQEFESRLEEITLAPRKKTESEMDRLTNRETSLAKFVIEHWKQRKYVRMAESILQNAATLKEAQIMSHEMEKMVVFQFTIVDEGHTFQSSYDLVLNGVSAEEDEFLEMARKPCVGVRVMDFHAGVVHLWSLEKLQNRVRQMRQIYQYLDRPEYLQHFRLGDPFTEPILPQYSLIGDVDVPLTAIFESRSQDFALDVTSPYTQSVVGIIKLTIEPSTAETRSTLKFNVIMRDMIGFAEREGTEVHAQMFIPGVSDESGATTTTMVSNFDEGPIRFDSTHSMSMPLGAPLRNVTLRVAIFAKITGMHLEKLISWDDMRDHSNHIHPRRKSARLNENEFYTEERHDVFARAQILELAESGEYLPVEVVQQTDSDPGAFQLHQGLQRRLQLSLTHSSGETLQWSDVQDVRIGSVRLLDPRGKIPDLSSPTKEIRLPPILGPVVKNNPDGTSTVTIVSQWDSSLHNSILLDRTTADKYRVQMCLRWNVLSTRLSEPILFSLDLAAQIQPRLLRAQSRFMQLWNQTRITHAAVGLYQLTIRPAAARRAGDLWRMNTLHRYVKGEEYLQGWTPRSVSLVRDFVDARRRRERAAEVENAKGFLWSLPGTREGTPMPATPNLAGLGERLRDGRKMGRVLGDGEKGRVFGAPDPQTESEDEEAEERDERTPEEVLGGGEVVNGDGLGISIDAPVIASSEGEDASTIHVTPSASINGDTEIPVETQSPSPAQSQSPPLPAAEATSSSDMIRTDTNNTLSSIAPSESASLVPSEATPETVITDPKELEILRKYVSLWSSWKDPSESILVKENTEPPRNGACFATATEAQPPRLIAEVRLVQKSSTLLKSGYLLTPDPSNKHWTKRYFELRRPYIHVHSVPDGEEIMAINLSQCRIDHQPQVAKLLRRPNVFAVYAPSNTYLFAARSERELIEWVLTIDQQHFGGCERGE